MGVSGVKADQDQAVLGACKHASSQLILKTFWRGRYYYKFADEGTEGQSGRLAQSHMADL